MADKKLRQRITISLDDDKGKVRIATMNNSLKRHVAFLRAMQGMREEMDRVWKDFFEKNPDEKEEVARRWLEDRLNSKDQHKGVLITVQNA
jgi:succinate dehydrogenase flavin-adding protein (antitoxin of CptAB toxin-antitoxin module)